MHRTWVEDAKVVVSSTPSRVHFGKLLLEKVVVVDVTNTLTGLLAGALLGLRLAMRSPSMSKFTGGVIVLTATPPKIRPASCCMEVTAKVVTTASRVEISTCITTLPGHALTCTTHVRKRIQNTCICFLIVMLCACMIVGMRYNLNLT